MILAYAGLAAMVALAFTLYARTVKQQALKQAEISRCLASRPQLQHISVHLRGVNLLARVLVQNSEAALRETSRTDPQWSVRVGNLRRLEAAERDIAAVQSLPVPSREQCLHSS
jgi:hypothetical protein